MANEKTPVVWDDTTKKHRPLGTGEKMGGLDASSIISSDSGNLIQTGSDGLAYVSGSSIADPRADNLLETSQNGKLQVTPARIAEWLDGHPQDAALIADAINVVSGDAGNVIVQGTDKGAYLSKGAISAAVAGMTDAQKNQLADAIAARIASDIADGKTIVASGGKLTVDPTSATAAQKKAINQALADQDSGLVVDNSTGKLKVDFSNMPTDKFEELLKSLDMLVPLKASKQIYVDKMNAAAGDSIIDGRGTQAKPFKTIQAAVDYVTGTYAIGNYNVFINIGAASGASAYEEGVRLPNYSRGTGFIELRSASGSRDVEIAAPLNANGSRVWCAAASGGVWRLRHIKLSRVEHATSDKGQAFGCVTATNGAEVYVYGCAFDQSFPSSAALGGETYEIRLLSADAAQIRLQHDVLPSAISSEANANDSAHGVHCFVVLRQGALWLTGAYDADASPATTGEVACSGSCDVFATFRQGGSATVFGGGTLTSFTGAVTGKAYSLSGGSYVAGGGRIGANYFPGTVEGTVDSATYCWYQN